MIYINRQSGAVFFYILLGIALLAALSYAVSRGSRSGPSTLTDQQAKLAAQEIIDYGNTVAAAVQKLRLRGCSDTEISFGNSVYKTHGGSLMQPDGHNPNAPTDKSCDVYKANGGNINPWIIPDYASYFWVPGPTNSAIGTINARYAALEGKGDDLEKDLFLQGVYVKKEVCLKINNLLNIENPSGLIPMQTGTSAIFNGNYSCCSLSDDDGVLNKNMAFCATTSVSNSSGHFIQVLISR